jgi:hypothetical protein
LKKKVLSTDPILKSEVTGNKHIFFGFTFPVMATCAFPSWLLFFSRFFTLTYVDERQEVLIEYYFMSFPRRFTRLGQMEMF